MIKLDSVSKSFDGKTVIDRFSYEFEQDKMYALTGDSGIGKTTLLNLLCGIYVPDSGNITSDKKISFGCVFQDDRLFEEQSSVKNIKIATKIKDEKYIRAELSSLLPADELDKPVKELSGGMRRRVCIVRAVLSNTDVLLLDEPFAGLDENNIKIAMDYILSGRKNRTIVMTSHTFDFPEEFIKIQLKNNGKTE